MSLLRPYLRDLATGLKRVCKSTDTVYVGTPASDDDSAAGASTSWVRTLVSAAVSALSALCLKAANNLSDLSNVTAARANLGVTYADFTSSGQAQVNAKMPISQTLKGTSWGCSIANNGTGRGIHISNGSSGVGIYMDNSGSGVSLAIFGGSVGTAALFYGGVVYGKTATSTATTLYKYSNVQQIATAAKTYTLDAAARSTGSMFEVCSRNVAVTFTADGAYIYYGSTLATTVTVPATRSHVTVIADGQYWYIY